MATSSPMVSSQRDDPRARELDGRVAIVLALRELACDRATAGIRRRRVSTRTAPPSRAVADGYMCAPLA
jgi:hypothetical protein